MKFEVFMEGKIQDEVITLKMEAVKSSEMLMS